MYRVFAGSDVESHLSARAKSLSVRSRWSTPKHELCAWKCCRIDEDVIQIDDDYDVDHICEDCRS